MGGSAINSDSKSSALCRHPRSLGPQDTWAVYSLTEQQGAKLGRERLSMEGWGRQTREGLLLTAPWLPSQQGVLALGVDEHAGRG